MFNSLISLVTSFSVILKCMICYLLQTLVKEIHGGSEIVVVVWIQKLDERTGGRRNGRMRTGRKLRQNYIGNYLSCVPTFVCACLELTV